MNNFYPKCFCVHRNDKLMKKYQKNQENIDPTFEWDRFSDYYRVVYAESLLKHYLENNESVRYEKVLLALNIAEKRLLTFQ